MKNLNRLLLAIILTFVLSHALTIENQVKLAKSTYVEINLTRVYQVTISQTIVAELSEIKGRQYTVELSHVVTGIYLNEKGDILSENEPSEQVWEKEAIETIEAKIVQDYARIEHIKKYGDESTEKQNNEYLKYFQNAYGRMYDQYLSGGIKLGKKSEGREIVSTKETPKIILETNRSNQSQIQIIRTENTSNVFSANFSNASVQPGDTVYIIQKNETIEKAIIANIGNDTIILDRIVKGGSIILNEKGEEIGFALADSKEAIGTSLITKNSERAGSKNVQSQNFATYAQALDDLENSDYSKTIERLRSIMSDDPKEEIKNTLESVISKSNEPINVIRKPEILGAMAIIVLLGAILLGKDKLFKKKENRSYSIREKDFE